MNNWKAASCALAAGFMIFTTVAPLQVAKAEKEIQVESPERAQQIKDYQKQIEEAKKEIEKYEQERVDNEKKQAETQQNLTETQALIVKKNEEIAALEKKIEQRQYVIKSRLVALQGQETTNLVTEVLVDAKSFADLLDRISSVSMIIQSDKDILEAQERDTEELKKARELVLQKEQELREFAAYLEKVNAEIVAARQAKQTAVDDLDAKIQALVQEDLNEKARKALEQAALFAQRMAEETSITTSQQAAATAQTTTATTQATGQAQATQTTQAAQTVQATQTTKAAAPAATGVIAKAQQYLGVPYVFGGASPRGFDCSGFISYVYGKARQDVAGYWSSVTRISADQLQPGDLVFFQNTYKSGPSHIGIYVGNGQMIHAGSSGIAYSNINSSYNRAHFLGYGRF